METTLHTQLKNKIVKAFRAIIQTKDTYRIQELVDWINANGGINNQDVTYEQVKDTIIIILRNK